MKTELSPVVAIVVVVVLIGVAVILGMKVMGRDVVTGPAGGGKSKNEKVEGAGSSAQVQVMPGRFTKGQVDK